jgi:alpha-galactosidase
MQTGKLLICGLICATLFAGTRATYEAEKKTWTLSNDWISASFQLSPEGYFLTRELAGARSGDVWTASPNQPQSLVSLKTDADVFDAGTAYNLVRQFTESVGAGTRQTIVLRDLPGRAEMTLVLEIYTGQPVLRYSLKYRNLAPTTRYVTRVNLLPWTFQDLGRRYTAMRVNQWSVAPKPANFEPSQTLLDTGGAPMEVNAGSAGEHCGWLALRDLAGRGWFAGWEFDGRSTTTVRHVAAQGYVQLSSSILDLRHPVGPSAEFTVPSSFLGLFHGDFDEAAWRTQRFVEAILAKPAPDGNLFPYVSWDSWGYEAKIEERMLRRNAEIAAAMGVQLFTVDLGWSKSIGDWHPDPAKFPNGLAALADYVHSLGMKFGLHFALAEAAPGSPVLRDHPDWMATDTGNYFGAKPLCLSNKATQDWLIREGIRIIDEFHVDWIVQDGQNMVKQCARKNHTHDPQDSNYANSVQGINAVIEAIQAARPRVNWENCENGGNMMTFNVVKRYVTSITNDASGALPSRSGVYGATFPFPPRYAERYMPTTDPVNTYTTHSYRFGGPWVLMNQLTALQPASIAFLTEQIRNYKSQRFDIACGKVYHLTPPGPNSIDAIQSYNRSNDTALAVVTRAASGDSFYVLKPRGLKAQQRYTVRFEIDAMRSLQTGAQLMSNGVRVPLPGPFSSEVVHIEPIRE